MSMQKNLFHIQIEKVINMNVNAQNLFLVQIEKVIKIYIYINMYKKYYL